MKHFITLANDLQLYSVQRLGDGATYAADFYTRMNSRAVHDRKAASEWELFTTALDRIAQRNRSLLEKDCLRDEAEAYALPSEASYLKGLHLPAAITLRLYCFPAGPRTLILFNGDFKTNRYPDRCPRVARHFAGARRLARRLADLQDEWHLAADNRLSPDPFDFDL